MSISPTQAFRYRWFSDGLCPPISKIDGFLFRAVGVCLYLQSVGFVSSVYWHDDLLRFQSNVFTKPPWPPPLKMVLFCKPLIMVLFSSTILPGRLKRSLPFISYLTMGSMVLLELVRSVMNLFMVSRTIIKTKESDNEEATAPEYNRKVFMIFSKGFVNSETEAALRSRKMFPQQNKLKIQLYWVQSKIILSPWTITTKHVISCSESVWNRSRCNRWIASKDLLKEKKASTQKE